MSAVPGRLPGGSARNGLPPSEDYTYRGTGRALRPEDVAAYVRLRAIRRHAIATDDDAPLPDSLMAPPEVHRERSGEEERALLATSRAARAAVPAPTVIRLEVEPTRPALPAIDEESAADPAPAGPADPGPDPAGPGEPAGPQWCDGCGYRAHRCCCPGGPRGGARC